MPKIIENLENNLIEEARRQIKEFGYSSMTIRSVAKECGVGVGTVYNYFPSKDDLIAAFMLSDWKNCMSVINDASVSSDHAESVLRCIYDQLLSFADMHHGIVHDTDAASTFAGSFGKYHALLRSQLATPLRKFCCDEFTADFIAESLLVWTMSGKGFVEIYHVIQKLM